MSSDEVKKYATLSILIALLIGMIFVGCAAASTPLTQTAGNIANGDYHLDSDLQLTGDLSISGTATLDLRGKTITASATNRMFQVSGHFTLKDTVGGGKLTGAHLIGSGGAVYIIDGGTFLMEGGNITNCWARDNAAGVIVYTGCMFIMNGGNITNCNAQQGAGVHVDGTFVMNGGNIINCSAKNFGGGVRIASGTFTMNGGSIAECKAQYAGGVYVDGTLEICNGATIYGNTVTDGTSASNVYLINNEDLHLIGDFFGNIGINGTIPIELGEKFGVANPGVTGAKNIFADDSMKNLIGNIDGSNNLVWKEDVITIGSVEEWNAFAVNSANYTKNINITSDLNFVNSFVHPLNKTTFLGDIEGNGHVISNFVLEDSGDSFTALIINFNGNRIANLTLSNFSVSSSKSVGGLIGHTDLTNSIENVHVMFGDLNAGFENLGGLVGEVSSSTNFVNCSATNCMFASSATAGNVGGLVGFGNYASFEKCNVANSSISGNSCVGGLIGCVFYSITSFMSECTVSNCIISGGSQWVGGFVGNAGYAVGDGIDNCQVVNCTIAGISPSSKNVGGLIGLVSYTSAINSGNVLKYSAIRGDNESNVATVIGCDGAMLSSVGKRELSDYAESNITSEGTAIWLNNKSGDSTRYPRIIIAKSAESAKQGLEVPNFFNEDTYGEPSGLNAKIVTRLTGYGIDGKYEALAYVYESSPEYLITNIPSSTNGSVTAYNTTIPVGAISQAPMDSIVHLVAINNPGYHFVDWNVTNSTGKITVGAIGADNFTMPAEAVNVDANFTANVTSIIFHNDIDIEEKLNTFGQATNFSANPIKLDYTFVCWNVSSSGLPLTDNMYVAGGNWNFTGYNGGVLDAYANWTQNPVPQHTGGSSSHQTGYTQIILEEQISSTPTPTATPTQAGTPLPTDTPVASTPQPTQQSPAPFAGLLAGLGAAALVLARMRL